MLGKVDLQELSLDERAIAEARYAHVGEVADDQGAGPGVVTACRAAVAGIHRPENSACTGVERIEIGVRSTLVVGAADVHDAVHHRGAGRDSGGRWIAVVVWADRAQEGLPLERAGRSVQRVFIAIPGSHVDGARDDGRLGGDDAAGLERPALHQGTGIGGREYGFSGTARAPSRVVKVRRPVFRTDQERRHEQYDRCEGARQRDAGTGTPHTVPPGSGVISSYHLTESSHAVGLCRPRK